MNVKQAAATVAAAAILTGCTHKPAARPKAAPSPTAQLAQPPSAASLAAKLGCRLTGQGPVLNVAAYDTKEYVSAACGGGYVDDILTFASSAQQTDWLHQNQLTRTYPGVVEGHLWVVFAGVENLSKVTAKLGGKEVDF